MVQAIPRGGGDYATYVGSLCDCFVEMWLPVKTQVKNGLCKLFDFSDQAIFTLKYSGLCDK